MFVLYPFLFVAFYRFCKKFNPGPVALWKKMREITKNGGDGPLNPNDDMPYRIMPHVISCLSTVDDIDSIPPEHPIVKKIKPLESSIELPIRKKSYSKLEYSGKDETKPYVNRLDDEYLNILRNMKKYELLKTLENSKISEPNKLEMINLFDKTHGETHVEYKENIRGAGLMKDWDFDPFTNLS